MNFTHRFDRLQFGVDYPGIENPLDGVAKLTTSHFAAFTYFITIVPTIYVDRYDRAIITSQYAVTEFQQDFDIEDQKEARVPGIFIKYDIDPISVRISESGMTFTNFLVRTGGIIGGIWVVMSMLYRFSTTMLEISQAPGTYQRVASTLSQTKKFWWIQVVVLYSCTWCVHLHYSWSMSAGISNCWKNSSEDMLKFWVQ